MSVLTRGSFLFLSFLLLSPLSGAERDDDGLCSASDGDGGDGGCHEVDSPPEDEGDEERRRRVEKELGPLVDSGLIDESLNSLDQTDPALIAAVRERGFLEPPPPKGTKYNFTEPISLNGQFGAPRQVEALFLHALGSVPKDGFFVEAGAYDGEYISHSLLFEVGHGWGGILVEPNPDALKNLRSKNRRAFVSGHCLSTKSTPEIVEFDSTLLYGGIVNPDAFHRPGDAADKALKRRGARQLHELDGLRGLRRKRLRVQCIPLYTLLAAAGRDRLEYLVLDVEGAEIQVLENIPWDLLDVKVVQVELTQLGTIFMGTFPQLENMFKRAGFSRFSMPGKIDGLYVKKDLLKKYEEATAGNKSKNNVP